MSQEMRKKGGDEWKYIDKKNDKKNRRIKKDEEDRREEMNKEDKERQKRKDKYPIV